MSDLILKREIRRVIRESGFEKSPKMVCSILKVLSMKHKTIDNKRALKITRDELK